MSGVVHKVAIYCRIRHAADNVMFASTSGSARGPAQTSLVLFAFIMLLVAMTQAFKLGCFWRRLSSVLTCGVHPTDNHSKRQLTIAVSKSCLQSLGCTVCYLNAIKQVTRQIVPRATKGSSTNQFTSSTISLHCCALKADAVHTVFLMWR